MRQGIRNGLVTHGRAGVPERGVGSRCGYSYRDAKVDYFNINHNTNVEVGNTGDNCSSRGTGSH